MTEGPRQKESGPDSGSTDWSASERRSFQFPEGGPDVAITGFDVNRATVGYDPDDEASQVDDTLMDWSITGLVGPEGFRPDVLLIGDLQARRAGWFAGCTVVAHVDFRDPKAMRPDPDDSGGVRRLAGWASSAMYDFGAARVRAMVAASLSCEIEVPKLTPRADLDRGVATFTPNAE